MFKKANFTQNQLLFYITTAFTLVKDIHFFPKSLSFQTSEKLLEIGSMKIYTVRHVSGAYEVWHFLCELYVWQPCLWKQYKVNISDEKNQAEIS